MLKLRMKNGMIILGIDAENVRRLKDGKPISLNLTSIGGPDQHLVVMYGDTLDDVKAAIELATGFPLEGTPPPPVRQH